MFMFEHTVKVFHKQTNKQTHIVALVDECLFINMNIHTKHTQNTQPLGPGMPKFICVVDIQYSV